MNKDSQPKIEKLKSQIQCPHNFSCIDSQNNYYGTTKRVGYTGLFECEQAHSTRCDFSIHFGNRKYCNCPVCLFLNQNDLN